jgi:hypothetical protein
VRPLEFAQNSEQINIPVTVAVLKEGEESYRGNVTSQAARFLRRIPDGTFVVVLPMGQRIQGPLLGRLYMSAWDHNRSKPKPLGKPCKGRGLLEEAWWDAQGRLNCTCNRGLNSGRWICCTIDRTNLFTTLQNFPAGECTPARRCCHQRFEFQKDR